MKIQVETVSPVEKRLIVEVEPEQVAREVERAYAALGRRVKLRGFRPGKAPRQVLERQFKDEVERDVADRLVQMGYGEAVSSHGVEPVAPPRVDLAEPGVNPQAPFRFTARVEVKPRLEPRDYRGLEVARRPASVTDAAVEAELERIRESMSRLEPAGREEAREGDFAVVDHEATAAGQPFEGGKAQGVTVRVAEGDFFAGFFPQLAGRRVGETAVVEVTFPASFRAEALRGKQGRFVVTLRAVQEKRTPALDDDLARSLKAPGVETLEQLRADLRRRMEAAEKARETSELHDGLVRAALARNDFEVPPAMVERVVDQLLEGAAQRFARQGIDLGQLDLDAARLRAGLREKALLQVRGALLLEAVAEAEKIEPSEADLEAELGRVAAESGMPVERLRPQLRSAESRAALRNRVREDQVLAFLAAHAKITDGEGPK